MIIFGSLFGQLQQSGSLKSNQQTKKSFEMPETHGNVRLVTQRRDKRWHFSSLSTNKNGKSLKQICLRSFNLKSSH